MNEISEHTIEGLRKLAAERAVLPEMARKLHELVNDYEQKISRVEAPRRASAFDDRRQRAREAGYDAATRVQITPEIAEMARAAASRSWAMEQMLRAAFEAAGFEVEE